MKKYLILPFFIVLGLCLAPKAHAAISFVNGVNSGELSPSVANITSTLNTTAGNLLIVGCRGNTQLPTTASDTIGNQWTLKVSTSTGTQGDYGMFYTVSSGTNANDIVQCNFAGATQFRNSHNP